MTEEPDERMDGSNLTGVSRHQEDENGSDDVVNHLELMWRDSVE
jgi:hypothetical protein